MFHTKSNGQTTMDKTLSSPKEYVLTNGRYRVRYTLIEQQSLEEGAPRPAFSLIVERDQERAVLEDFTHEKSKALPLLEQFCEGAVLPEEVEGIGEDLLADFDFVE